MTPEAEKTLRLLKQNKDINGSLSISDLTDKARPGSFRRTRDILYKLRDDGYISFPRLGAETDSFTYKLNEKAYEYFYNLEVEAKVKEELRNQAKQQHRHDVFLLLIGGIISLILDNIGNIFLFLKSLFTT